MTRTQTRAYRSGSLIAQDFRIEEVSEHLDDDEAVVWIDFLDPSLDDLDGLIGELGLHELAVDDAIGPHQRPKLDKYASHMFLACHAMAMDIESAALDVMEVDVFVGGRWMITIHKSDHFPIGEVLDLWDRSGELVAEGVSFLLYRLLDVVVDSYLDVIEVFDEYYDGVSENIFSEKPINPSDQRHWFVMGRSLMSFHRLAVPIREVLGSLVRADDTLVSARMRPYFHDVYDHVLRAEESAESLRELVSTIVSTNLNLRDYRQNQVMKKVTSWAAIVAIPTLVTGFYGMNVPYPGFGEQSGVLVSVGLIVGLSALLYGLFRWRDWL